MILDFVRAICRSVVVLHQGAILMEGTVEEVVASDLVKAAYAMPTKGGGSMNQELLSVEGLHHSVTGTAAVLRNISLRRFRRAR